MQELVNEFAQTEVDLYGPVQFRDDGERIIVYPDRRDIIRRVAATSLFVAGLIALSALMRLLFPDDWRDWAPVGLAALLSPVPLLYLFRLLVRIPSLTVGPDGILENASLIGTEMGLLNWDSVMGVGTFTRRTRLGTYDFLSLLVASPAAIRRRLPLWKRTLLVPFRSGGAGFLHVPQALLDEPPAALAERIKDYVRARAPSHWIAMEDDDEAPDSAVES